MLDGSLGRYILAACHFPLVGRHRLRLLDKEVSRRFTNLKNPPPPPPLPLASACGLGRKRRYAPHRHWQPRALEARSHGVHSVCRGQNSCAQCSESAIARCDVQFSDGRFTAPATKNTGDLRRSTTPPPPPDRRAAPPGRPPCGVRAGRKQGGLALPRSSCARSSFSPSATSHVGSPALLAAISAGC